MIRKILHIFIFMLYAYLSIIDYRNIINFQTFQPKEWKIKTRKSFLLKIVHFELFEYLCIISATYSFLFHDLVFCFISHFVILITFHFVGSTTNFKPAYNRFSQIFLFFPFFSLNK